MPEIRVKKLRKEFKDIVAVRDVTVSFPANTLTCLLGPSGCGKTTFLRMIAGLEEPTNGEIYFGNECVNDISTRKRNISMIFQYPVIYRGLNVYRNIDLPLKRDNLSEKERRKRIEEVLEIMGLQDSIYNDVSQLDNSSRQKVAVARVMARKSPIILLDEPLTNVDIDTKDQIKKAIKDMTRKLKQTIIYVTHDQTEAMTLADKIALMNEGMIIQHDEPRDLYNYPDNMIGGWFLGNPGMNFFEVDIENNYNFRQFKCAIFEKPVHISGIENEHHITIGIRPENVKVLDKKTEMSVQCEVIRKSIVTGGQYLLVIKLGEIVFKAKVRHEPGSTIQDRVWVEFPLDSINVFGQNGNKLNTKIVVNSEG